MLHALKISIAIVFSCIATLSFTQNSYYKFIENKGQHPDKVLFTADLENGTIFFEKDRFTYLLRNAEDLSRIARYHAAPPSDRDYSMRSHAYEVMFDGSSTEEINGANLLPGVTSYFKGNDPNKWGSGCKSFAEITYLNLYEGIDLRVYANDFLLKFEYYISPGVDPSLISQVYNYTGGIKLRDGKVEVKTNAGMMNELKPISFQKEGKDNIFIASKYVKSKNEITYEFPESYDNSKELVIDPELVFSTYSGSFTDNFGYTATFDDDGFLYSGSSAFGSDYPVTLGSFEENWSAGVVDIALSKVDTTGTFLIWSAYLGGTGNELPHSIMVNENDELYVLGSASSNDFPTSLDAYSSVFGGGSFIGLGTLGLNYDTGSDIILARISADGSDLLGSTYIGGADNDGLNFGSELKYNYADEIRGEIQLDEDGNVFVVSSTYSTDFPVSLNAAQPTNSGGQEAVAFMMSPDLSNLEWSTYVGGTSNDAGYSLTFDSNSNVIICGGTQSVDFPLSFSAIQGAIGGDVDGFFTRITNAGQTIDYSTYYGSSDYDQLYFIETDASDNVYVFGQTEHTQVDFILNADYNTIGGGQVITKFDSGMENIVWSTAFGTGGGQPNISPTSFLVDVCDRIYLSGWGGPTGNTGLGVIGMDVTPDAYKDVATNGDFYLMVLLDDASDIFYGSFFGGNQSDEHVDGGTSRFSRKGQIYQAVCAGCGSNDDFPIVPDPGAVSETNNSLNCNLGVFKFDIEIPTTIADFNVPNQICVNQPFTVNNQSIFSQDYTWDFGDGSELQFGSNPTHTYLLPGTYEITLSVSSAETCNGTDQITETVTIEENSVTTSESILLCSGDSAILGIEEEDPDYQYTWSPVTYLTNPAMANPTATPLNDIAYILSIQRGACIDTLFQTIELEDLEIAVSEDLLLCDGGEAIVELITANNLEVTWSSSPAFADMLNDSPTDYTINPIVTESTTFYVLAEGELCSETAEVQVAVFTDYVELEGDLNICAGDTINVSVVQPLDGLTYTWTPAPSIISGQGTSEVLVTTDEGIVLTVEASSPDCEAEDSITIGVINDTGDAFIVTATPPTIISGQESQLTVSITGLEYTWQPSETLNNSGIQNPIATPLETTTYLVTAGTGDCVRSGAVTVTVVDFICGEPLIFLPNAFSPNADNENDVLYVYGQNLTEVHLAIFNRWGQKVFETYDQSIGWDGIYNGEMSSPAVFDYYLEVTCEGGVDYFEKGNVTLVR